MARIARFSLGAARGPKWLALFCFCAAALLTQFAATAAMANSADSVNGSSQDLTSAGSYASGLPITSSDVEFSGTYSNGAFTLNGPTFDLTAGTLDDLSGTTLSINDTSGTADTSTIMLYGGSNSVAPSNGGAAGDLLFVASGGTLSIGTANTAGDTLNLSLAASGNFDIAGTATIDSAISGAGYVLTKTGAGTLNLNGATTVGSLYVGYSSNPNGVSYGTLAIGSGGTLSVGSGSSSSVYIGVGIGTNNSGTLSGTLDASAAASVVADVGSFEVGGTIGGFGYAYLGANNTITATTEFGVCHGSWGYPGGYGIVTTAANSTTAINTPAMYVGQNVPNGTTYGDGHFTLGSGGTLSVAGIGGGRTSLAIGVGGGWNGSGDSTPSVMDLTGGGTGVASLKLSRLMIGQMGDDAAVSGQLLLSASGANHLDITGASGTVSIDGQGSPVENLVTIGDIGWFNTGASGGTASGTLTIGNLDATSQITATDNSTAIVLAEKRNTNGSVTGVLNLEGGSLTITTTGSAIAGGGGTSTLTLGGAGSNMTLIAGASSPNWIENLTTATINTGGVTFNTNGYGITIPQVFAGTGALAKSGAGTLTLSAANAYTGGTAVNAGTLIATNSAASSSGGLTVGSGATFAYQPTAAGSFNLGAGSLTLQNNSTIGAALGAPIASSAAASVTGTVTLTPTISPPGFSGASGTYNLITAASGLTSNSPTYVLSNNAVYYNTTNYTVGGLVVSDTAVGLAVTNQTALANVYWKGGFSGYSNVWAVSDGSANSNWTQDSAGLVATSLVPGPATVVNFSASGAVNQGAMVLGAPMTVDSLVVSDPTTVTLNNDGNTLTLGPASSANGIRVNSGAGAVTIATPVALGAAQTWTNNSTNPLSVSGTVTNGGNLLTVAGSGNSQISGAIGGSGGLTQAGAGTLTLSASNSFTGATNINGGILSLGASAALAGGGAITFGGGTLQYSASNTQDYSSQIVNSTGPVSIDTNGQTVTFASGLASSNVAGLTKVGAGTLVLRSSQNYGGATVVSGGVLQLQGASYSPGVVGNFYNGFAGQQSSSYISGVPALLSYFAGKGTPVATQNSTAMNPLGMDAGGGNCPYFPSGFANNGNPFDAYWQGKFYAATTGTYYFQTTSDDGSGIYVNGTLVVNNFYNQGATSRSSNAVSLSAGYNDIVIVYYQDTGGLDFNASFEAPGASSFATIPNTLLFTESAGANNILPATTPLSIASGATLDLDGTNEQAGSLANSGTGGGTITNTGTTDSILTINGSSTTTFSGTIVDGATNKVGLTIAGGTQILTGSGLNTYSGPTMITGGTLRAGAVNALSPNSDVTVNGGTLDTTGGSQLIKSLTMASSGTLSLSTSSLLTATNLSTVAGTLDLTGAVSGQVELINFPGGYSGNFATNNLPANEELEYLGNQIDVINIGITWGGQNGSAWDTSTKNWYNGGVGTDTQFTTGIAVSFNDAPYAGAPAANPNVTISASGGVSPFSVTFNNTNTPGTGVAYTITSNDSTNDGITGSTGITLAGTGTVTLIGQNTYTGATTLTAGILNIGNVNSIGAASAPLIFKGGTLQYASGLTANAASSDISFSSSVSRTVDIEAGGGTIDLNGNRVTFANSIGGAGFNNTGSLTVMDSSGSTTSMLTLQDSNTFTGGINLNGGIVNFTFLNNLGAGAINFGTNSSPGGTLQWATGNNADISARTVTIGSGGATLDLNGNNITLANSIGNSGSGGLSIKSTAAVATLTLAAANIYTGGTNVNSGTLRVTNTSGSATGSGSVTVTSGATVAGSGMIGSGASLLSVQTGGIVAPSLGLGSPAATLAVNGNVTLASGAILDYYLTSPGGSNDLVTVTGSSGNGNLTLSGGGTLNITGSPTVGGTYELLTYTGTPSGSVGGWSVPNQPNDTFSLGGGQFDVTIHANSASESWISNASPASFDTTSNWTNGLVPNGAGLVATFGTGSQLTVSVNGAYTVGQLNFNDSIASASYYLTGNGSLTLNNSGSGASVNVSSGGLSPAIATTLVLADASLTTTFNVANGSSLDLSGTINESTPTGQQIVLSGGGVLTMEGSNNFTGGTTIQNGTLVANASGVLGTGSLTFNPGSGNTAALDVNTSMTVNNLSEPSTSLGTAQLNVASSTTLTLNQTASATFAGTLSLGGAAALTLNQGSGNTLTISGAPTLASLSSVLVNSGTLALTNNTNSPATVVGSASVSVASGATLQLAGSQAALTSAVNITTQGNGSAGDGALMVVGTTNQTVGIVSGNTVGSGPVTMYSGNTTVGDGTNAANLTATQILQNTLTIDAGSTVTIAPSGSGIQTEDDVSAATALSAVASNAATADSGNDSSSDPFTAIQAAIASGSISSAKGEQLENRIAEIEQLATTDPGLDVSILEDRVLAMLPPSSVWSSSGSSSSPLVETGSGLLAVDSSTIGSSSVSTLGGATAAFAPAAEFGGSPAAVPEPSSLLLAALGGIGILIATRRRTVRRTVIIQQ